MESVDNLLKMFNGNYKVRSGSKMAVHYVNGFHTLSLGDYIILKTHSLAEIQACLEGILATVDLEIRSVEDERPFVERGY